MGRGPHLTYATKRQIIFLAYARRDKQHHIADAHRISLKSVENVLREFRKTGEIKDPVHRGRRRVLNGIHVDYLESLIARTPDAYLLEMKDELVAVFRIEVSVVAVWQALQRRGYRRKQVSRLAAQRDEDMRAAFQMRIAELYEPEHLVFVDEAACNRNNCKRAWAWARIGHRARRHDMYIRGTKYSIIPALSLDGVLHLDVLEGSVNATRFNAFIDLLLDNMNTFPHPNSVIVLDNASIHKHAALRPMIEARGMRLEYLSPYSPDFDPIEEGFSSTKAWIRRHRQTSDYDMAGHPDSEPFAMIWRAVYESMTSANARKWYAHSGYI